MDLLQLQFVRFEVFEYVADSDVGSNFVGCSWDTAEVGLSSVTVDERFNAFEESERNVR